MCKLQVLLGDGLECFKNLDSFDLFLSSKMWTMTLALLDLVKDYIVDVW